MARARTTRVARSARRRLVWARQANSGASIASGADSEFGADLLAPFRTQLGVTATPGLTVVRIRLSWRIVDTSAQSRMVIAGIRKYTNSPDTFEDELENIDGPSTDPHADWMMFDTHILAADGADDDTPQRDVDVKSMRRLDEASDSLAIVFQAVDELAAQVRYVASVLVALP